ncbi:MAG TPA: DNA recombination protein RmuC [Gaiellaceae bacterium]|jgi:DNA recombination protein RmuC|nr:DNA recombination protein RmuC [Gaiellaceae bacterium]
MANIILILLLGVGLAAGLVWLARLLRDLRTDWSSQLSERTAEVDRRLLGVTETMDRRLGELDTKVDRRLESATQTTNKIHERLGKVDEATTQMLERAKDLARLEQALRPPKARGGFGELLLENLLRDRLPPTAYEMQYTFDSGERVDALLRVDRSIPIDSKFPLDNYNRLVEAENDDERTLAERQFARDVKQHIEAIATKYIRPDEGTYDFAFMYIPVEAVYYELACGKTGALLAHAHERRVFPVSPTTFTAYLQVIALGLRGMQIEQHAHEVMAYVAELQRDFDRFADDFDKVGTHIGHAQSKYHEASKRLDRFEGKLERAVEEQGELETETLLELPGVSADAA